MKRKQVVILEDGKPVVDAINNSSYLFPGLEITTVRTLDTVYKSIYLHIVLGITL